MSIRTKTGMGPLTSCMRSPCFCKSIQKLNRCYECSLDGLTAHILDHDAAGISRQPVVEV